MKYEIGAKIRFFRELKGYSQKEFANKIGVSNSRVSNWEQGVNRPDADVLVDICKALEVSADALLDINKKTSESTEVNSEISHQNNLAIFTNTLKELGLLNEKGDISNEDFVFLRAMFDAIHAHFKSHQK